MSDKFEESDPRMRSLLCSWVWAMRSHKTVWTLELMLMQVFDFYHTVTGTTDHSELMRRDYKRCMGVITFCQRRLRRIERNDTSSP